jgi:hypothetical protein
MLGLVLAVRSAINESLSLEPEDELNEHSDLAIRIAVREGAVQAVTLKSMQSKDVLTWGG